MKQKTNTFTHLGKTLSLVFRLSFSQSQLYSKHFSPPPGYTYLGSAGGAANRNKQFFSAFPSFLLFSCALPQAAVPSGEHMVCHKRLVPLWPWCFLLFLTLFFSFFLFLFPSLCHRGSCNQIMQMLNEMRFFFYQV